MLLSFLRLVACVMLWVLVVDAADYTKFYFIDKSCADKTHLEQAWIDAVMLAGKAIKHFDDVTDTDFQAVYLRLMEREDIGEESEGTPEEESEEKPDPKPYEEYRKDVRDMLASVAEDYVKVPQFDENGEINKKALVRLYCDEDARWVRAKNEDGSPRDVTHKDGKKFEMWEDKANAMWTTEPHACTKQGLFGINYGYVFPAKGELRGRRVISICNRLWDENNLSKLGMPWRLDDIPKTKAFDELSTTIQLDDDEGPNKDPVFLAQIDHLMFFPAVTILHEMMHTYANEMGMQIIDWAYLWKDSVKLPWHQAAANADSYVLLAISAWLADRGFSLPRIGTLESEAQKENDKLAADGRLAHLKDITGNRGS